MRGGSQPRPLVAADPRALAEFEHCIASGGVAVFPADTVYGLACDPLDPAAVGRLHRLKGRDPGRPCAVMFFDAAALEQALPELGPRTAAALAELLPGPFTLVLPNPEHRFPLACDPTLDRLGIRLIDGPLAGARHAVIQSSANPSGGPDPREIAEIDRPILAGADLVLDAGRLPGTPSTVVDLGEFEAKGKWSVLREGAVGAAEVEARLARIA